MQSALGSVWCRDSRSRKEEVKIREKIKNSNSCSFEKTYPNTTRWVKDYGCIEIGQDDYNSSLIRVLDEGGMVWESDENYETMDEAMQALETGLADWMKEYE